MVEDEVEIVVQIKGKVRAKLMVAKDFHAKNCKKWLWLTTKLKQRLMAKKL